MIVRRTLLAAVGATVAVPLHSVKAGGFPCGAENPRGFLHREDNPDATLLALCAQLEQQQAEWQRLYDQTSDADALTTPADFAWEAYCNDVWPGLHLSAWSADRRDPADLAARLVDLPATTLHGLRAKAAAVLAMEEAGSYLLDCRNDSAELMASVLRDAAGSAHRPLGAEARTPLRLVPSGA